MADFAQLKRWVDSAESSAEDSRQKSERDRDYYDGNQLTQAEIATLKKRKQPIVIDNRIQPMVNHLIGLEIQRRTDPRALPRTPNAERDAEAATDALRFVEETTQFDRTASQTFEDMVIEGIGAVEVGVEQEEDGTHEITIKRYAWDRLGYDPASAEPDFSDARFKYVITWMDYDEALAMWPDAEGVLQDTLASSDSTTTDDKPRHLQWRDSSRRRVKIALMYYQDGGVWNYSLFSGGGEIDGGVSPYVDEDGDPQCPLIFVSAYVDRDNNRYGAVRNMISMQDEINKRRSKLLHLLNSKQFFYEAGALNDVRRAKQELASPDGGVEINPGKQFQIIDHGGQLSGQFALHAESMQALDKIGPSALAQGKAQDSPSGRAILASQQGGLVELAKLFDAHSHFKREVYRHAWMRIRQYWTEERWVRVTDDENNVKFVGLNRQTTMGEQFIARLRDQNVPEDQAKQQLIQALQQQGLPLEAMLVPVIDSSVAEIDVDIMIEEAPDTASLQYEQFEMLTGLAQAGVVFPPKVYIEAAPNLRNRQKLIEIIEGMENPEAAQKQQQMQEQAVALEFAQKAADVKKTEAEIVKLESEAIENKADAVNKASQAAATRHEIINPPPPSAA